MPVVDQLTTWLDALSGGHGSYLLQVLQIIWIDIVLAGDNAVVIALACRTLPPKQRMWGIILGAAAAVLLRVTFTLTVSSVLAMPWLKIAGGLILIWIAVKLLNGEEASEDSVKGGTSLWEAVRIVAIADAVMSLDNVLAVAAAAHGDWNLIVFGLLVSIPLVVAGSTLITSLLTRYPILVWAGAALLGWVAGQLIAGEPALREVMDGIAALIGAAPSADGVHAAPAVTRLFQISGAALVCAIGYWMRQRGTPHES